MTFRTPVTTNQTPIKQPKIIGSLIYVPRIMYMTPRTIPSIPVQKPYLLSLFPMMMIKPIIIRNIPDKEIVNADSNANIVGLNINPKLTTSIIIPRTIFNNPLVWL